MTTTISDIDTRVLGAFRSNKFSSIGVISHIFKIQEKDVQESVSRLLSKRKIYQSVGGVPERYSAVEPRKERYTESSE